MLFKIQSTGFNEINFAFISSPKMVFYDLSNSNSGIFSVLPTIKKKLKLLVKIPCRIDIISLILLICLYFIKDITIMRNRL